MDACLTRGNIAKSKAKYCWNNFFTWCYRILNKNEKPHLFCRQCLYWCVTISTLSVWNSAPAAADTRTLIPQADFWTVQAEQPLCANTSAAGKPSPGTGNLFSALVYQRWFINLTSCCHTAKQIRKLSLFQISQMWWIHIFQYWGGRGGIPHYWECLRKEREKGLAFIYSKNRHKKISVLREISNPHSKSIWSIPVIHGEYKMVPKFHVEKAKIMQIYLDAGGINKC